MYGQTVIDNAKVSPGPAVTPHSSIGWAAEALLTAALILVAVLPFPYGNLEQPDEEIQAVTEAPPAVPVPTQPVAKSALRAAPKAAPPLSTGAARAAVPDTKLADANADIEMPQESPSIPQPQTSQVPVPQETQLADGDATEAAQKKPIARVTGALKHLNPLGWKKAPVVKTTTAE